jgi:hypothetical protein
LADLFDFFVTAGQHENVAPQFGTHTLDDYFRALVRVVLVPHTCVLLAIGLSSPCHKAVTGVRYNDRNSAINEEA